MFEDGVCQQINNLTGGWQTPEVDDWVYYPQQYGKIQLSDIKRYCDLLNTSK